MLKRHGISARKDLHRAERIELCGLARKLIAVRLHNILSCRDQITLRMIQIHALERKITGRVRKRASVRIGLQQR